MINFSTNDISDIAVLAGVTGAILGAFIAGGIQIYINSKNYKNNKISNIHAFKAEINAILEIIKLFNYQGVLKNFIETKEKFINDYKEIYEVPTKKSNTALPIADELNQKRELFPINNGLTPLMSFYIETNENIVFVKNTLKGSIGLLDETAGNIIIFYTYINSFLLSLSENQKNNNFVNSIYYNEINIEKIKLNLKSYYETYNIKGQVMQSIEGHKILLDLLNKITTIGNISIIELEEKLKQINKNKCLRFIDFIKNKRQEF